MLASTKQQQKGLYWNEVLASKEEIKEINHLYTEHYMRAASGLLSAIGNDLYKEATPATKRQLKSCIARISRKDHNPQKSEAKCLLDAYSMFDKEKSGIKWIGAFGVRRMKRGTLRQSRLLKYGQLKNAKVINFVDQQFVKFRKRIAQQRLPSILISPNVPEKDNMLLSNTDGYERKKSVPNRMGYVARSPRKKISIKKLTSGNMRFRNTAESGATSSLISTSDQNRGSRYEEMTKAETELSPSHRKHQRRNGVARLVTSAERRREKEEILPTYNMQRMPNLMASAETKSPIVAATNLVTELVKNSNSGNSSWKETYKKIRQLNYQFQTLRKIEDQNRAFDNALWERSSSSFSLVKAEREAQTANEYTGPFKGIQAVNAFIERLRQSQSQSQNEDFAFLSPKIAPLMPIENTLKRPLLSPTLFSFYKDENDPNNIASVPQLLNYTEWNTDDRDAMMSMIMEVSGAREQIEQTLRGVSGLADWQDVAEAMINANLRMNSTWMKLLSSLTKTQRFELDTKGFSFASHNQIKNMYFKDDAYYKGLWENDIPLDEYEQYDNVDRKYLLRRIVGKIASDNSTEMFAAMRSWPKRMKQRLLAPFAFVNQFLVPSVFGYTILSPNIFVPNTLSPVLLNLELLTPRVMAPIILGPRVLAPRILGPRVMVPQILVPLLFAPSVLRPLLLSPYILAPSLFSPGIMSPNALGGRILSPALLQPPIFSPAAINADILSPSLLSKRRKKRMSRWSRTYRRKI